MKPFTFAAAVAVSISLAVPAAASVWGSSGQGRTIGGTPTVTYTAPTPRFGFGSFAPRVAPTIRVTRGQWQRLSPVIQPVRTLLSAYAGSPSQTPGHGQTGQQPDPIAPVPLPASALLLLGGLGGLGLMRRRRKAA